jgi:type I restriction enzyme S subunit
MVEWPEARLGDLLAVEHGYAFPGFDFSETLAGRPIIVTIGNFDYSGGFRFDRTRLKECAGEVPDWSILHAGDVLVVMTCQTADGEILGVPGRVPADGRVYLHNQRLGKLVVREPTKLDLDFAYWLMLSPESKRHLFVTASGSKILHTAPRRIEDLRFQLPPLDEQRAIAGVLGALDDKIESNRRIWTTSLGLIEACRVELVTAAATTVMLGDLVTFNATTLKPGAPDSRLVYIDIASVSPGAIDVRQEMQWSEAPSRARRGVSDGDVIFSTVRPTRRSFSVILEPDPDMVVSTGFAVMTPRAVGTAFLLATVADAEFASYCEGASQGSAYPAVSADAMARYEVTVPSEDDLQQMESALMPVLRRGSCAQAESATLAALRDALVPELLSGRLRVREAERVIEDLV